MYNIADKIKFQLLTDFQVNPTSLTQFKAEINLKKEKQEMHTLSCDNLADKLLPTFTQDISNTMFQKIAGIF